MEALALLPGEDAILEREEGGNYAEIIRLYDGEEIVTKKFPEVMIKPEHLPRPTWGFRFLKQYRTIVAVWRSDDPEQRDYATWPAMVTKGKDRRRLCIIPKLFQPTTKGTKNYKPSGSRGSTKCIITKNRRAPS